MKTIRFVAKQYLKMFFQLVFLPIIYALFRYRTIDENRVIFADAHHTEIPFSMQEMHKEMERRGFEIVDYFDDYSKMGITDRLKSMVGFMKIYATAKYVFLCDYYLPAAACRKKKDTVVVQLWHSGGLLKKIGFDAVDDIPSYYKLNPHKNYTLMTVSAECCIEVLSKALRLPPGVIQATGISRSDCYFSKTFTEEARDVFWSQYPKARDKKIILWAPTFRGNSSSPFLVGTEDILKLQKNLGEEYLVLIKAHPHIKCNSDISNCSLPSEQLLPVIDLLITDYSSILFDYIIYEKPFVLFVPDYKVYEQKRGFYVDYSSLPGTIVKDGEKLDEAVQRELKSPKSDQLKMCRQFHMGSCDGHSTQRILKQILEK